MSRPERTTLCLAAAVLAGMAGLAAPASAQEGGRPPTAVRVVRLERQELQERRRVTGELRPVKRSRVATNEPGLVAELPVEEGELVKRGDVIAVLNSRRIAIDLRRQESRKLVASAAIQAMEAELALERRDVDTLRGLVAQNASNRKELDDAESAVLVATARLEGARRDLDVIAAEADLLRERLEDTTILAPIDGVVVATNTERGEWVAEGDPIVEIVSVGTYDAWLDVPQRYAAYIMGRREPVQIEVDASGFRAPLLVPKIVPLVDPTARTFAAYVRIEDEKNLLAAGMSVTGWVATAERGQFLTVPRDALMRNQAGFFVYVARGGAVGSSEGGSPPLATPVPIRVEFETDREVAVRPGALAAGDLVVVEGNERLFPMMPLAPTLRQAAAKPAAERAAVPDGERNGGS